MAFITGTTGDDTLGFGNPLASKNATAGNDLLSAGAGNDTLVYNVATAGGNDIYLGGTGADTLKLQFTAAEFATGSWKAQALNLQALVDSAPKTGGQVAAGTTWLPKLNFGGKTVQVYEVEKVEIYVDGVLYTGNLPVTITSPTQAGAVQEDGTLVTTGTVAFSDADITQPHTPQVTAPLGAIGSLVLSGLNDSTASATGSVNWTYTLNNAAAQYLGAGETKIETFVVSIDDGNGSIASQAVTITITGQADIANTNLGTLKEAGVKPDYSPEPGVPQAVGQLVFVDVPPTATWSVDPAGVPVGGSPTPVVGNSDYGYLSITPSGVWTFDLSNTSTATQLLDAGETKTLTYTVAATYDIGAGPQTVFKNVIVTINGTNDLPVMTVGVQDLNVIEAGGVANALNPDPAAAGNLTVVDPDGTAFLGTTLIGTYGNLTIAANGDWTYGLRNGDANVQALKGAIGANPADQVTDTLTLTVDGASHVFVINITGADDKPTLLIKDTATPFDQDPTDVNLVGLARGDYYDYTVTEAGGALNGANANPTAGGQVVMSDPDTSPLPPLMALSTAINPVTGFRFGADLSGETTEFGKFTLDTTTGVWGFSLRNDDANVQALTPTDTVTERLVIQDESGSVTREVRVTITGADDLVNQITNVIDANGQTVAEAQDVYSAPPPPIVVSRNATPADELAGGTLDTIDPDAAGPFNVPADPLTGAKFMMPAGTVIPGLSIGDFVVHGTYGDFSVNVNTGVWSYDLNTQSELDEATPTNDADRNGNPNDDNTLNLNGALPPDWTYSNAESLIQGQIATESFVITSWDGGTSTTVTVQVIGHNDAADIFDITNVTPTSNLVYPAAFTQGDYTVLEAGGLNNGLTNDPSAGGKVASVDPDANQSGWTAASSAPVVAGTYGTFTFDYTTGAWTYALNNSLAAVQQLRTGETLTDTLNLTAKDGTLLFPHAAAAPNWTVTINGANDFAIISDMGGDKVATEAGGLNNGIPGDAVNTGPGFPLVFSASGDLDIVDADGTGSVSEARFSTTVTQVPGNNIGTFFLVDVYTGEWRYQINEFSTQAATLDDGQSIVDSAIFFSADGSASQQVDVVVHGKTDLAGLGMAAGAEQDTQAPGTTDAGGTLTTDLTGIGQVVQLNTPFPPTATTFSTPTGTYTGIYGSFTFDASNGVWTYVLNADDADTRALAAGVVQQDTLSVTATSGEVFTIAVNVAGANTLVSFPGQFPGDDPAGANTPVISPTGTLTYTVQDDGGNTGLQLRVQDDIGGVKIAVGTATVNDGTPSTYTNPVVPPGGPAVMGELLVSDQVPGHADQPLNVWIGQGTDGNDSLTTPISATAVGGMFTGYGGDDVISASTGTDFVDGGTGNDLLFGNAGSDTMLGGDGVDSIDGGADGDDLSGGAGNDDIVGGLGDDTISGGADNDTISGGNDADLINGDGGDDLISGDQGTDTIDGGSGNDTISGGNQADMLSGGAGDDELSGGNGGDTLNGGTGNDGLVGGLGNDSFDFRGLTFNNANSDQVFDFNNIVGDDDRILLTASQLPGYETFTNAQLHVGLTAAWFATTTDILLEDYGSDARMVFDTTSGNLYFDPDGAASGLTFQLVAEFGASPAVPNINDFVFTS